VRTVLLDTVGLIALWETTDQWHLPAEAAMQSLRRFPVRLVTTTAVLLECGNAAARKPYRNDVFMLRHQLVAHGDLIPATDGDVEQAWQTYQQQPQGAAGIVDHVSFAVMRRLRITEAFTNDRHFQAAGFTILF
jgi:uncharacterized protein